LAVSGGLRGTDGPSGWSSAVELARRAERGERPAEGRSDSRRMPPGGVLGASSRAPPGGGVRAPRLGLAPDLLSAPSPVSLLRRLDVGLALARYACRSCSGVLGTSPPIATLDIQGRSMALSVSWRAMLGAPVTSPSPSPEGGNSGAASCAGVGPASRLANDVSDAALESREWCGDDERGDVRPGPGPVPSEPQSLGGAESSRRRARGWPGPAPCVICRPTLLRRMPSTSASIWSAPTSLGARAVPASPLFASDGDTTHVASFGTPVPAYTLPGLPGKMLETGRPLRNDEVADKRRCAGRSPVVAGLWCDARLGEVEPRGGRAGEGRRVEAGNGGGGPRGRVKCEWSVGAAGGTRRGRGHV